VIVEDKPRFMKVNEILKYNTEQTVRLLKQELEIKRDELMERILFSSLEKIFIEKRIYRDIEECETFEAVIKNIDKGLKPYKKQFYREITEDDIVRLTEIRIKRISKYDSFKADELLKDLENQLKEAKHNLKHLTDYAIGYYQNLLTKYGKGRERRTEIKGFQSVTAAEVIATNQKLYVNKTDGFIGWSIRKDEFICECSEMDDIIAIRKDGKAIVSRIAEKVFMGKDILYAGVWKKGDERMVYNMIYSDGTTGKSFAKRFTMPGIIRDKEYDLAQANPNSKVHYLSANPNGEAEVVEVKLTAGSTARKKKFEFDFTELEVKGRGSRGNTLTKYPVRKVDMLQAGVSTLSGLELWFDPSSGRLNKDGRGRKLGKFDGDDQILGITRSGNYKITSFDLNNRYDPEERTLLVEKFNPKKVISAVYVDGESKQYFVKRFQIETTTPDKEFGFISESIGSRLEFVSTSKNPELEIEISRGKEKSRETEVINLEDLIDIKGWKALGNRLSPHRVVKIRPVEDPDVPSGDEGKSETKASESSNSKAADAQGLKKKSEEAGEPKPNSKKEAVQSRQAKKASQEQKQGSLFEESPQKKVKPKSNGNGKARRSKGQTADKAFGVGETIELEL
jgi:topoisomerase-4 subunit A